VLNLGVPGLVDDTLAQVAVIVLEAAWLSCKSAATATQNSSIKKAALDLLCTILVELGVLSVQQSSAQYFGCLLTTEICSEQAMLSESQEHVGSKGGKK
jgi:hypothetical protein